MSVFSSPLLLHLSDRQNIPPTLPEEGATEHTLTTHHYDGQEASEHAQGLRERQGEKNRETEKERGLHTNRVPFE